MVMTDPIADMLTRIRNANQMHHKQVEIPASKLKEQVLSVLKKEGFIVDFTKEAGFGPQGALLVTLKYNDQERVIKGLKRISKPGLRVYVKANEVPKVLNGLGIAILSTSQGVMTDKQAREKSLGGEVLAYIW